MKENIYSTKNYSLINEIQGSDLFEEVIEIEPSRSLHVFGIGVGKLLTFGIYAPFWLPSQLGDLNFKQLAIFAQKLIAASEAAGCEEVKIRLPPSFYCGNVDLLKFQLARFGFSNSNVAVWQTIDCRRHESAMSYEASLKHSSKKVLRRFVEQFDFEFRELDPLVEEDLAKVYDVLQANRMRIGTRLKYSINYLTKLAIAEFERVKIFEFLVQGQVVAAALCHLTSENVLYVVAWGDATHEIPYSPMYKFASELVAYCLRNSIQFLDFGVSSDLETYTPNLYDFKANIGCGYALQETLHRFNEN